MPVIKMPVIKMPVIKAKHAVFKAAALCTVVAFSGCVDDGKERVVRLELSPAALNDYQGTYAVDQLNKAFAVSPDGAYAASYSFPSEDLAVAAVLLDCNSRVRLGELECMAYDINGKQVAVMPARLRRK